MSIAMEILEWADSAPDELVRRIPGEGSSDIKMGAQLIVQQSQTALFFRDGKCLDALGPGRHVLSTLNLPLLTNLLMLPYGFRSPFRASVYFVNRKVFTNLKWGTKNPVVFRDAELGLVRLRGYGLFALRIEEPMLFVNTLVGPRGEYHLDEMEEFLRDLIVARLNDFLGEKLRSLFDLPASYNEIAAAMKVRIREDFRRYGIELTDLFVNSITPPEEVQRMVDHRSGMGVVGDLDAFLRFEAARAVGGLAGGGAGGGGGNGGGGSSIAGNALEAGVGASLGLALLPHLARSNAPQRVLVCSACGHGDPEGARFCAGCGAARGPRPVDKTDPTA